MAPKSSKKSAAKSNPRRTGRPRGRLPEDVLSELGRPPDDDPIAAQLWWSKLLAEVAWLLASGRIPATLAMSLRAIASSAAKALPEEIKARAARILEDEDRELQEDVSPRAVRREDDPIARASKTPALRRDPS